MNIVKAAFTAALAAVAAYFQQLIIPVLVLVVIMALDYISGVSAAWVNHELSSRTGVLGIVKKVCYLLVVAVGVCVDYMISLIGAAAGVNTEGYYFVALVVTVWMMLNECISILENVNRMGLPVPGFMEKLIARLKESAENKVNIDKEE